MVEVTESFPNRDLCIYVQREMQIYRVYRERWAQITQQTSPVTHFDRLDQDQRMKTDQGALWDVCVTCVGACSTNMSQHLQHL